MFAERPDFTSSAKASFALLPRDAGKAPQDRPRTINAYRGIGPAESGMRFLITKRPQLLSTVSTSR